MGKKKKTCTEYKMNTQQRHIVDQMQLCSMLCASLDGRQFWGKTDICIRMAESLCSPPETAFNQLYPNTKCFWC